MWPKVKEGQPFRWNEPLSVKYLAFIWHIFLLCWCVIIQLYESSSLNYCCFNVVILINIFICQNCTNGVLLHSVQAIMEITLENKNRFSGLFASIIIFAMKSIHQCSINLNYLDLYGKLYL